MKKIVVVGSLNVDFIIDVAALPQANETIMGQGFATAIGGKGLNQAVACARLGAEVHMAGAVGDDSFGIMARQFLGDNGVNHDRVAILTGTATGVANILVAADGQNMIVVSPGANAGVTLAAVEAATNLIASADAVIVQHEVPRAAVRRALEIARTHGVLTVLNPAPVDLQAVDLFPLADVLTPNETELARLTGITGQDDAALLKAMGQLPAKQVIVTLGDKGCATVIDGVLHRLPAYPVTSVDATGAGDVFNGALTVRLAEGDTLVDAMRLASAASALSVTKPSANAAPTYDEVIRLMSSG